MIIVALLIGIFVCIIPIAIISLIVFAIIKRNKDNKNSFEESVRNIYIYIILIITLIGIIAGVISAFRIGLDVILPEKSIYETSYSNEQRMRNENITELFTEIALVISIVPVFIHHNNLAKEARKVKIEGINN